MFLKNKLEKFYEHIILLSDKKSAIYWLCFLAYVESFVFLVPPYVLMVPMILANRSKAWKVAFFAMIFSVFGGLTGYYIGRFLFDMIAIPMFEMYGYMHLFESFGQYYQKYGLLIIFIGGLTPLPYKIVAIMSGAVGLDIAIFIFGSIMVRGIRFYLVAFVLYKFGINIDVFLKKNILLLCGIILLLIIFSGLFIFYMR